MLMLIGVLLGVILAYFLAVGVLGIIPVNAGFKPQPGGVRVYVINNGVHSDIVLPARSDAMDWTRELPIEDFRALSAPLPWVAFGWGDRGFYLDIPTWSDLTFKVAIVALSGIDSTLMHVHYLSDPRQSVGWVALDISQTQHQALIRHVHSAFRRSADGRLQAVIGRSYGDADAFYQALGRFSLFVSCNEWVRRGLSRAGIRTAAWSPLMWSLFWQLRKLR